MQIGELYRCFFDPTAMLLPYQGDGELLTDLFSVLDICLNLAAAASGINREEAGTGERRFKGFASAPADLSSALLSLTLEQRALGLSEEGENQLKRAISHVRLRLAITEDEGVPPAFVRLCRLLSLSAFERFALLVVTGASFDKRYEAVFAGLHNSTAALRPTGWLIGRLYAFLFGSCPAEAASFAAGTDRLHRYLLTEPEGASSASEAGTLLPHVGAYIRGEAAASQLYAPFERFCGDASSEKLLFREDVFCRMAALLRDHAEGHDDRKRLLHLYGPSGIGKRFLLQRAAAASGLAILYIDADMLSAMRFDKLCRILDGIYVKCLLFSAVPCFSRRGDGEEEEDTEHGGVPQRTGEAELAYIRRLIGERFRFSVWLSEERETALSEVGAELLSLELPMLSAMERLAAWQYFSAETALSEDVRLPLIANQYILTVKGVRDVLSTAALVARCDGRASVAMNDIADAVRQHTQNQLGRYATRIKPVFTWDDLIIDEEQKSRMRMICDRVKYRSIVGEEWGFHKKTPYGRGVCALFYGSPGTGKTMAVQVIARELGLDLYRIDLSQMSSKYIGETQKNISRLFKRAKNINAVLFFDEADSMFSKRSGEIKDSNDRYANADTAHLLQQFEEYDGIAILATNYVNHIDDAFKRRIKFMVNFVFPAPEVRLRLWKSVVPPGAVLSEEPDFEFFAEHFELSGSNIKEIVTCAAYFAAAEGEGMANRHIIRAVKLNFEKYGKSLTAEDFGYLGT